MAMLRGWCPGALTPMESGDGLLVRVRPRAGRYSIDQVRAIAQCANAFGNGEIDLTNRANLQLRGLSAATLPGAIGELTGAGLIDESPELEAIRNVIVSPLAELAHDDGVHELAGNLEAALADDHRLAALPGKFGFAIDSVSAPLPGGVRADVRLTFSQEGVVVRVDGAGALAVRVEPGAAISAALALTHAFLRVYERDQTLRRMRDAVAATGAAAIYEQAKLKPVVLPEVVAGTLPPAGLLGPAEAPLAVGIGLPYGRISGAALAELAGVAARAGATSIRPSPQRCLVVPLGRSQPGALLAAASEAGLIVSAGDPRLAMDVCPGAPACARGSTPTRTDAGAILAVLAQSAGYRPSIHVSGCVKGCARGRSADLTLVARDGRYDLIRNGRAIDTPVLSGLTITEIAGVIAGRAYG